MAKFRMSPIQEMNLMNAATGDIPLSATSYSGSYLDMYTHDIMGTLFRNQSIRKAEAAAKGPGKKGFRGESLDISGGKGVIDELRQRKLDRHQLIINSFYNSMHEGMWEGAKALALEFHDEIPGLLEIYRTEYEKANVESIKSIINTFYNNVREGLWDGAKIIAERFKYEVPGLREAYKLEQEKAEKKAAQERERSVIVQQISAFEKTGKIQNIEAVVNNRGSEDYNILIDKLVDVLLQVYEKGYIADIDYLIQCAGMIKGFERFILGLPESEGVGSGGITAYNLSNRFKKLYSGFDFFGKATDSALYRNGRERKLPAGTVVSESANSTIKNNTTNVKKTVTNAKGKVIGEYDTYLPESKGHTYMVVGYDEAAGKNIIVEQAGIPEKSTASRWFATDKWGNEARLQAQTVRGNTRHSVEKELGLLPRITTGFFKGSARSYKFAIPTGEYALFNEDLFNRFMERLESIEEKTEN